MEFLHTLQCLACRGYQIINLFNSVVGTDSTLRYLLLLKKINTDY